MFLALRRTQLHVIFSTRLPKEHLLRFNAAATCSTTLFICGKRTKRTEDLPNICLGHPEQLPFFWLRRRSCHSCVMARSGSEQFYVNFTGPRILQPVQARQAAPQFGLRLEHCHTSHSNPRDTDIQKLPSTGWRRLAISRGIVSRQGLIREGCGKVDQRWIALL